MMNGRRLLAKMDSGPLSTADLEDLVRWFDRHMPMDMRHQLMAELPQHYRRLTGADPDSILGQVDAALREVS